MKKVAKIIPGRWHSYLKALRQEKALVIQENEQKPARVSGQRPKADNSNR